MPEEQMNFGEKSKAQVSTTIGGTLTSPLPASYKTYRTMRKHPTISLTRAMVAAPVLAGSWSVEADDDVDKPDDKTEFIRDQFEVHRERIMESSIKYGRCDFGWQPFELVFHEVDNMVGLEKPKPLLHDITTILVGEHGEFVGFEQNSNTGNPTKLLGKYAMNISFGVEGTNWYGTSLMENSREYYNQWRESNAGAERYDAKIAGSHWVIHYPVGTTDIDGVETDNADIADDILEAMESSGSVVIPNTQAAQIKELSNDNPAWRIELLEDKGSRQPGFTDRLNYLDKLLVRSFLMPERSIMEGQFGTKAEAGAHADLAITQVTLWDRWITNEVNKQAVDTLLEANYGKDLRGKVYLVSAPLADAQLSFLQGVYTQLLTNASTVLEEFPTLNTDAIKDRLGVPKSEETAPAGEEPGLGLSLEEEWKMVGKDIRAALALPIGG